VSGAADTGFGTIVVVGGGCYGSQYVRQLRRARAAGKAAWHALVVVDRSPECAFALARRDDPAGASDLAGAPDGWRGIECVAEEWRTFFDRWLAEAVADPQERTRDAIVPSPLMPHLLYEWLAREGERFARRRLPAAVPNAIDGVPWQQAGGDGTRYVSFATWICPINCIEPAKCPHTKGPRDWSLHDTIPATAPAGEDVALLKVTHRTFGVGMIDVVDVIAAHETVRQAQLSNTTVRVATASHCHGAVARIGGGESA
jgi:hypothetical protein